MLPGIEKVALLYDSHLDQTRVKAAEITARNIGIQTLRLGY
jgi:hypothetical protein